VFYFARKLFQPLKLFQNYFDDVEHLISKSFQCFILHVTASEIISKLFQPLKLFRNYFGDIEHVGKYSRAAISL